ncbi:HesA/MoeB/ThiF family protein [Deinococcus pimensis]|uniref:HesA/MoeB/ThiF family protein n=1 Tax=Deinococcus pimensis TaxID=309888 RepID=UPI000485BAF0|nr:HesA/MoeB/ThiF family protein [Deinococcus pimensis]
MLSRAEIERYSRQLLLPDFEGAVERLRAARVLVVGAGGLGTPLVTYLAGAGVGRLTLCDDDTVSLSNLQRQVLYATPDVGRAKTEVAASRLQQLNPGVRVETRGAVTADVVDGLVSGHDVVVDASDNFTTRYLLSDACGRAARPLVWGAAGGFEGMLSVFSEGVTLRDVFPEPGGDDCDTVGVLGPLLGVVASAMAVEVLKLAGGVGEPLVGRLWTYDALSGRVRVIRLR